MKKYVKQRPAFDPEYFIEGEAYRVTITGKSSDNMLLVNFTQTKLKLKTVTGEIMIYNIDDYVNDQNLSIDRLYTATEFNDNVAKLCKHIRDEAVKELTHNIYPTPLSLNGLNYIIYYHIASLVTDDYKNKFNLKTDFSPDGIFWYSPTFTHTPIIGIKVYPDRYEIISENNKNVLITIMHDENNNVLKVDFNTHANLVILTENIIKGIYDDIISTITKEPEEEKDK